MSAFVDTNVFLYAFDSAAQHHSASHALIQTTLNSSADLVVSPQIFCELYRYLTHPLAGTARSPDEVRNELVALFSRPGIEILPVPPDLTTRIVALLQSSPVRGREVFDVQIAATMLANGVSRIYTYNTNHFSRFEGIQALTPEEPKE